MAWYYVKNGGTATGDGGRYASEKSANGWATEFSATSEYYGTLDGAFGATTAPGDGDFVMVSDAHTETFTENMFYDVGSTTTSSTVYVLSVDDTSDVTAYSKGASIGGGAIYTILLRNGCFFSGVDSNCNSITLDTGSNLLQDCTWTSTTGAGSDLDFDDNAIAHEITTILNDANGPDLNFTTASTTLIFGVTDSASSVNVNDYFDGDSATIKTVDPARMYGLDLSNQGTTLNIFEGYFASQITGLYLPTSWTGDFITDAIDEADAAPAEIVNYGSGSDDWAYWYVSYGATVEATSSVYYDDSPLMYDGTTRISYKFDTTNQVSIASPFYWKLPIQPINLNDAGSNTVTVKVAYTGTGLKDTDIGLFIVYPDNTNSNDLKFAESFPTISGTEISWDPLATGTTLTDTGVETTEWTGLITGDDTYDLSLTVTAASAKANSSTNPIVFFRCTTDLGAESLYISTQIEFS